MRMSTYSLDGFFSQLTLSERPLVVVVAPNFEDRSMSFLKRFVDRVSVDQGDVRWLMFTLQGPHIQQLLDAIKARNARRCWQLLEEHRPQSARLHEVVQYPTEIERFVHRLASHIADLDAEVDLLIDYSSIPRRLLTQLLGRIAGTGPVESKLYRVRDLWLSYTWADSYPDAIKDEFIGDIVGNYSRDSLESLMNGKEMVELIIFLGGSVHEVSATLEIARRANLGNNLKIVLVVYYGDVNHGNSDWVLRNHHKILRDEFSKDASSVRFVYSIEDVVSFLNASVRQSACLAKGNRGLFAIAPFGPKPISVAAHFALDTYRGLAAGAGPAASNCEMLTISGSQYLSVYSLGESVGHLFRIEDV